MSEENRQAFKRSSCPLSASLDLLGDKWTLLLIRDMYFGCRTFGEFQQSPEKIPSNILSDRLKRLEQAGIVRREAYQQNPPRYEYHLTEMGRDLLPVVKAFADWGIKHIPGTRSRLEKAGLMSSDLTEIK